MGPVIFWQSNQAEIYIDKGTLSATTEYFKAIRDQGITNQFTCISIDSSVAAT